MSDTTYHIDGGTVQFSSEAGDAFMRYTYMARVILDDDWAILITLPNGSAHKRATTYILRVATIARAEKMKGVPSGTHVDLGPDR